MTTWTKTALRRLLSENKAITLSEPRALAQRPVSAAVRALNDAESVKALTAQEDTADLLLAHMRTHAPQLAARFIRDYPVERWKIDLASPGSAMLAVEVNGGYSQARGGKHGTDADHKKMRRLVKLGWRPLVFTANEVRTDPLAVIKEIQEALEC
jgi:very-short-patch-repair endonuclease